MSGDNVSTVSDEREIKGERGSPEMAAIRVIRSGQWLPEDELRIQALEALQSHVDVTVDLTDAVHLDCGTLQILMAMALNRREKGLCLHLTNTSPLLRQWFAYAGALSYLSPTSPGQP